MITDIELSNFQGFIDASLSLCPGLNVITGESDTGKSSIIRLLTWVSKNRPKGDSFRNHYMQKKDSVIGSVAFDDDSWVIREKGGKINEYRIPSSDTPLKALRTDVPKEVSDITKIADVNIQSQHPNEQYFMLTDSPGQVAKHFNKVAGLTIMDDALAHINSAVRKNKQEAEFLSLLIADKQEASYKLEWSIKAEKEIDSLLDAKASIKELNTQADILDELLYDYEAAMEKLEKYKDVEQSLEDLSKLVARHEEHMKQLGVCEKLMELVNDVYNLDKALESTLLLKSAAIKFYTLKSLINDVENAKDDLIVLSNVFHEVDDLLFNLGSIEKEIKEHENDLEQYSGKECPVCGGIV